MVNIMQIAACVGQQNCSGQRMQSTLKGRTLPMFNFHDNTARSRGFVKHSYIDGLTPDEYWHHTVGGREGLIDTAVKTSTTGYIQRRLVKSLESVSVVNDGTVRDAQGRIIQFKYGEDGLDGMSHEMMHCPFDDLEALDKNYNVKKWPELTESFKMWKWIQSYRLGDKWAISVPAERILKKHKDGGTISDAQKRSIMTPLLAETKETPLVKAYLLSILTRKDTNCSKKTFQKIIDILFKKWIKSIVAPGEMVGTIAAQSVGEPTTQMTLNTFHNAGNSAKNVTLGVPRFEELINASSKIKTPSLTIFTEEKTTLEPEKAWRLKTDLQRTCLKDVTINKTYEPGSWPELDSYLEFPDNERWEINPTPKRILHCILDREKMVQAGINIYDIVNELRSMPLVKHMIFAYNDDPVGPPHLFAKAKKSKNFFQYAKQTLDATIKGSKHIPSVSIRIEGNQFAIDTEGIDLNHIKHITSMNHKTIQCNDIFAIRQVYGIEAARATILKEMHQVLYAYGIYVNMRHLMTIVDWMTFGGNITALTRHGVKKRTQSSAPIKRATFEQPVEIFHKAAVKGTRDNLEGISEQLLIGIEPSCGSHFNGAITDPEYKKKWDNEDWQPPEEEEEDLFGEGADTWRPMPSMSEANVPDSSWNSHTTFATAPVTDDVSAWQQQQAPAWQQQQAPAWQQQQAPAWQQQQTPAWQQQQTPAWQQQQAPAWQQQQTLPNDQTYSPASPAYSPASPAYSPASPAYSPASPAYSPASPAYSPASPAYSPQEGVAYSPASPAYSPASPAYSPKGEGHYSPSSPVYSPGKTNFNVKISKCYDPGTNVDESPTKRQKKV
jgi:DNA-directed RNA polymerase II subunit RPB1